MRIVIDKDIDPIRNTVLAEHVFHTDDGNTIRHPLDSAQTVSPAAFIDLLNQNAELRETAGWNISSQHDGEDEPKTRWQRLVEHTDGPDGDPKLKALGLVHNKPAEKTPKKGK